MILLALALCAGASLAADEAPELVPRAAVFPFTAPLDIPDRMIGRRAGAAVHEALAAQAPWRMVEQGWLLRLCEQEDARAPFAVGYLQMLGQRMDAPLAVAGMVDECELNRERGVAQVTIVVELVETVGGASLASERGVASATREEGETLGQALDRALSEAAGNAARKLTSFDSLEAVIVTTLPDGRVVLDGPREPRIKPGAKVLVLQGDPETPQAVGTLEVRSSDLTVLHAKPLSGDDFRQGQKAVVVTR